ncbi:hypothetical protein EDB87DRAFT_1792581 [Lactarius vividus]|nr:hypothetical protein EDB87DRAFT_1792581 [Lactarius vividus]
MMNVTRLQQPPPQSSSTRSVSEAEDITPDFLSIRLVNKRTRVKISPEPLDLSSIPNKGQLFVVAGTLGWFVAIIRSGTGLALVSSPLADLRSQLSSQDANSDNIFQPQRTIPFSSVTPNYLIFACNDTRLIVGLTQGQVIVFDSSAICSTGTNEVTPLHTFLPTTPTPTAVRQMYANPGDIPELVALLREPDGNPDSQLVEVINVSTLQSVAGWSSGGTPETFPTSISWSPKGKQLAIALQSGDIITFSPSETQQAKTFVARPSSMQGQGIVHTTWLSNPAFYTIFSPVGPLDPQADQKHMVIVHDTKRSDASADITLPITFFPSGVRPPGAFTITLKGWDPAKILLIIGDSTTADIGLVCCTADDKWQKLSFDEGAPSMPLDADQNETTMIGFELDLKNTTPYDVTTSTGETVSVPPPPVVWAYANDGTVVAWYVVNTRGTPYPGKGQLAVRSPIVAPAAAAVPASGRFSQAAQPTFGQSSQPTFGLPTLSSQPSSFGSTTPSFGQSGFGQTSITGSAFAQAPTFGNAAFGAASSTFASPPGQAPSGGAFAAFAPASVNWGQTNFGPAQTGFNSAAAPAPPPQIQPAESTESMATDSSQELSFGAMSLSGSTDNTQAKAGPATTSMFGVPTPPSQPAPSSAATSTIGGGSFALSPGIGFAKFASKPADETTAPANVEVPKPSPAFGQTSFGSGFGQSGFGQSGFGQSGFGKTGLGTPMSTTPIATPINPTSTSTFGSGGGFGAFASGGLATFGGAKPAETKPAVPAISLSGGFGAFASTGLSAFGQAASIKPDAVPAWKTGGDATFSSGTGTTVFGGTPSASPLTTTTTPVKSMFTSTEPTTVATPTASPLNVTASPEKVKSASPFANATLSTLPSIVATPPQKSQSPSASSPSPNASPKMAADSAKPPAPLVSTTPVGTPPANAFMGLKMSTGFGLSNFNAKDSPFGNPKPVSQAVSAFGDQSSAPKVPVPATPGSVFGQTSVIGAASKPSPGFAQPTFGSPSASPSAIPSSSKTASSNAFSAFSGGASAFGKTGGSGVAFSDMLRAGDSSSDSNKSKEPQKTPGSSSGSAPGTPKSAFDTSPTPQPAEVPASHESDDEAEEKGKGQTVSAASSFSTLSSSTSSFVDVSRGDEEEEEPTAPSSDGGDSDRGEEQIEEFLSDTYSEGEPDGEGDEVEDEGDAEGKREERDGDEGDEDRGGDEEQDGTEDEEDDAPPSDEADPTTVPLPASRSPSSTPKAERPAINVQPTPISEPSSNASLSERVRSTTPPGSPSKEPSTPLSLQTPLQQPTPTLPSPSLSPSPTPVIGFGRPNTRPLRSSPLANVPVSGGDEEEVKGEKPASLKPHPASPRTPFGQWDVGATSPSPAEKPTPPQPAAEPLVDQTAKATPPAITRPKTPPLLIGTKGIAVNNNSSSSATAPATVPVAPAPTLNLGGFSFGTAVKPDTKPAVEDATRSSTTPAGLFSGFKPSAFNLVPKSEPIAGTLPVADTKSTAVFGATAKVPLAPATGPPFVSPFGPKPGAATPAVAAAGGKGATSTPARVSTAPPLVTPPKDAPSAEPLTPIQIEFTNLITGIGTELANLVRHSHEAREKRSKMIRPTPPIDVEGLAKTIRESEREIEQLELARSEDRATIRELEIGVLKAKTRKEEITRFDKAGSDVEFGKMLKSRFLSPEQMELQTQLRRNIRSIQDRVTKMEDHLQASKKKLNEFKTARPSIKPPSLDTVNRTSRNIDLAIRQQTVDVSALSARVAKLNLDSGSPLGTPSRIRERDVVRRPLDVTPHVASTTAAALNAEQSAHRLKEALLAVRTEPLLNTQAAQAKPARAFDTPQKPTVDPTPSAGASKGTNLFSTPFSLPPLSAGTGSASSSPPASAGRRASTQKYHSKSVPLKSAPTVGTPPKPSFDWGPLPGIKPMTTLSPDLRSKTG